MAKEQGITIAWNRDEEHGYRFASCYVGGPINRSYLRGDIEPRYPLPTARAGATNRREGEAMTPLLLYRVLAVSLMASCLAVTVALQLSGKL